MSLRHRYHAGNAARGIGIFPPERLGGLLIEPDIAQDFTLQVGDRSEDAAIDDLALEFAEPALDLIQPR